MSEWKETEIGILPDEWDVVNIGSLIEEKGIAVGVMYPGDFTRGGTPLLRAGDINTGKIDKHINYQISNKTNETYKRTVLQGGELLVVLVGNPGVSVVVSDYFNGWNVARAIGVLKLKDKSDGSYISYSLQHPGVRNLLLTSCNTTVQPTLNLKELKDIIIPWPTSSLRNTIASILTSLDDKIDLLHRQNDTLEAMAETLFRQWFVEEVKEDWVEVSLKDYISIKHGYAFKGNYISTEPTNLILVTPGNFKIGGGFKFDKFKYYTNENFPKDYIFKAGDLIVTMTDLSVDGNTLGYPAFVPENYSNEVYLHNQRVGKVEFINEIGKYFLHQLMKTDDYQWFVLGGASGTAIRHTSPTSICNYSFRMPPKSKVLEFETFANGLEEKNKKNQIQIRTLTALRDTLLPKLMSGEVRVN